MLLLQQWWLVLTFACDGFNNSAGDVDCYWQVLRGLNYSSGNFGVVNTDNCQAYCCVNYCGIFSVCILSESVFECSLNLLLKTIVIFVIKTIVVVVYDCYSFSDVSMIIINIF